MKFEKTNPSFSPVVITLETETEAQALRAVLAGAVGHGLDGDFLYALYVSLDDLFVQDELKFTRDGIIHLKEI